MRIFVIRFNYLEIEFGTNSFWFLTWSRTRISLGATTSMDESVFLQLPMAFVGNLGFSERAK
jgi:hypothetical protein